MFFRSQKNISLLRSLVREALLKETFQSHTLEPSVGDLVLNTNPKCKHHGSKGIVLSIGSLADDVGKTVTYKCSNDGSNWSKGDVLTKTMDQLSGVE